VADPLAGNEDGKLYVEGQDDLLEGTGVLIAQEVVDEARVLANGLGAFAVGDAGGLDDALVAAQVVHKADEPVVQHLEFLV
jgi:hypothetical protein